MVRKLVLISTAFLFFSMGTSFAESKGGTFSAHAQLGFLAVPGFALSFGLGASYRVNERWGASTEIRSIGGSVVVLPVDLNFYIADGNLHVGPHVGFVFYPPSGFSGSSLTSGTLFAAGGQMGYEIHALARESFDLSVVPEVRLTLFSLTAPFLDVVAKAKMTF